MFKWVKKIFSWVGSFKKKVKSALEFIENKLYDARQLLDEDKIKEVRDKIEEIINYISLIKKIL